MDAICRRRPCAVVPRDLVARIRELTIAANELERRMAAQVGVLAPGVGALTTAKWSRRPQTCVGSARRTVSLATTGQHRYRCDWGTGSGTVCHGPATGS